jgi:hypothetical protein
LGERRAAGDKLPQKRQKEGLAEPADRRNRLEIKGSADNVRVEFVQNQPQPQRRIETRPSLFDRQSSTEKRAI